MADSWPCNLAPDDPLAGFAPDLFTGRRLVVTGAASGIGQATALGLARYGASIDLVDRDVVALQKIADRIATYHGLVRTHVCDLGVSHEVDRLADDLGRSGTVHGLINNAGIFIRSDPGVSDPQAWSRVMAVNLEAVCRLSLACAASMLPGGAIVNIASTSALRASPGTSAYAASKAGVIGLTQALAVDLAPRGIRVNAVAPGEVATPMGQHDPSVLAPLLVRIPMGRQAVATEIASVVLFLASPLASYVTGATWLVDGGFRAA